MTEKCIIKIYIYETLLNVWFKLDFSPCTDLFYFIIKHIIVTKSDNGRFSGSNGFQTHGICSSGVYEAFGDTEMNEAFLEYVLDGTVRRSSMSN